MRILNRRSVIAADDAKDSVALDVPLLIRLLEQAREDMKSDEELHNVVERILSASKAKSGTLTMEDYPRIKGDAV